jgi:AcrR family transcriptional regulator
VAQSTKPVRQRVPAAERRDALIEAAIEEFGIGGLHGTPVDRIARRVGVAQPYVFSLFGGKRDLFIAAVERAFEQTRERFSAVAAEFEPDPADPEFDVLRAIGQDYIELLSSDRRPLMIQLQAYAACGDEVVREHVRAAYAKLIHHLQQLSGADAARIEDFMRYGALINEAAAMDVDSISPECDWVQRELERTQGQPDGAVVNSATASGTP